MQLWGPVILFEISVELLDFIFQESENWKSEDMLTFWGGFRGTFGVISLFKSLEIGNQSHSEDLLTFLGVSMELLQRLYFSRF